MDRRQLYERVGCSCGAGGGCSLRVPRFGYEGRVVGKGQQKSSRMGLSACKRDKKIKFVLDKPISSGMI